MRILLAPIETAGVAGATRDGLRARGHRADLVVFAEHPFGLPVDRVVQSYPRRAATGLAAAFRYDVLHYQFGTSLCEFADVAWSRIAGRPLALMHYWGDDCRLTDVANRLHPARARILDRQLNRDERTIRRRLRIAARLCKAALVSDLELASYVLGYFETVYVVPTPILPPQPSLHAHLEVLEGDGPIVFHAPSNRAIKGTTEILAAMEAVAARRPLRPHVVAGVPRDQVLAEIARADMVVDQLNSVTPGVFALEAMALGKPVLLEFDRAALAPFAAEAPLVSVAAPTLADRLDDLCERPDKRAELGEQGRRYAASVHSADRVAAALELVYNDARRPRPGLFEATSDGIRPLPSRPG